MIYYEVEVWWFSPKTKRMEMVFGKDLEYSLANNLVGRIVNYADWSELKSLIEKHEEKTISYLVNGTKEKNNKLQVVLTVN